VFVGTVTGVTDQDRTAVVEVDEIWSGHDVPARVTVYGTTTQVEPTTVWSTDRFYETGTRYLFAVNVDQGRFVDSACTGTSEWSADLEALRPTDARIVAAEKASGASLPTELMLVGTVILFVGGASVLAFRRR
jgi:uncharacterized protein YfaQ (DUF2300 family)